MPARPIIIDCDPGIDDAIALLLTLASLDELEVLGISTVAGNVPLELTQRNARQICELAGITHIPVYAGCPRPLLRSPITAAEVHGRTGLDGVALPSPQLPLQSTPAVSWLLDIVQRSPEPVTIVAIGPLTNLAVALIQWPGLSDRLQDVVIMGGAITQGNITPAAEFNFYADPQAAQVVMRSGAPITLLTLDVTHQAIATPDRRACLGALNSPVSAAVVSWLSHYGTEEQVRLGWSGPPLHDPAAIAYLLRPDLFTHQAFHVDVEIQSPLTLGRSVVDVHRVTGQPANANVLTSIDADGFFALLCDRLGRFSR